MNKKLVVALGLSMMFFMPGPVNAAHRHDSDNNRETIHEIAEVVAVVTDEDFRLSDAIRIVLDMDTWPGDIESHRRHHRLSYDEISLAHGMAYLSGYSLHEIIEMRTEDHMGWGRIAKEVGVKVSDAVHMRNEVMHRANMEGDNHWLNDIFADDDYDHANDHRNDHNTGKPQHNDNGDRDGKHDQKRDQDQDHGRNQDHRSNK